MPQIDLIKTLVDALPDKCLEIGKDINGMYMVEYSNGLGTHPDIKEGLFLRGDVGRGATINEAGYDYIQKIQGKTLVFDYGHHREEVKVAFLKEEPDDAGK